MAIKPTRVLIVAGEASGDLHGGHLVQALRKRSPGVEYEGVGGKNMRDAGVRTLFDIDRMGGMGLFEFFGTLWHHLQVFRRLSAKIRQGHYHAAILINYPVFNLKLAKVCRQAGCPALFYIGPQIWASRSGRIHAIRENVTKMYVILPFEEQIYKEANVPVEFFGHPFIDLARPQKSREEFLKELDLDPEIKTVGLMPGSRMSEVNYLFDDMVKAARIIREKLGACQFLLPVAPTIDPETLRQKLQDNPLNIKILSGDNYEVMNASDYLILASGSATLEAGLLGCPMVIIYKVHPLTYFIAMFFTHITHFGLVNIVAGEGVVPELLNEQVAPERIADEALQVLENPERMQAIRSRLDEVRQSLGAPNVIQRIAQNMIETMNLPAGLPDEKNSV